MKKGASGQWYGVGDIPRVTYDTTTYWVDVHHHTLVATQNLGGKKNSKKKNKKGQKEILGGGQPLRWRTLLDARISTPPVLIQGVLVAATHAGALYGMDPETGRVKWRTLIAPNNQQMVAFGQLESLWPCFGVVEHDGLALTTAGRVSTLDSGFTLRPWTHVTGEIKWRVNQVVESVHFDDVAKQIPGAKGWGAKRGSHPGQPFSRAYMSLNTPPMVTRGHLHGGGMLMVNLSDPKDFHSPIVILK